MYAIVSGCLQISCYLSYARISQKVKDVLMWNLQYIISSEDEGIGTFSNLH